MAGFVYHRLKSEDGFTELEDDEQERVIKTLKRIRLRRLLSLARRIRKPRVRIAGLMKKLVMGKRSIRRKTVRFYQSFSCLIMDLIKRLKKGRAHFNDLLAGNYLFMQVAAPVIYAG